MSHPLRNRSMQSTTTILPSSNIPLLTPETLCSGRAHALPVHLLVEEQVSLHPSAAAIVFEGTSLSYAALNERANHLAHYLRHLGVGPETFVGVFMERSLEMIVAVLGVLKAGGAYVPLDPAYPDERLAFMIDDTRMPVLLTNRLSIEDRNLWATTSDASVQPQIVSLKRDWANIAAEPATNPPSLGSLDSLAYVIYTSGSTGRPKGVLLQHDGLLNLVLGQIAAFELSSDSHVLQFASLSFDASVSEIFTTLVAGGTLYLAQRDTLISPPDLLKLLRREAITMMTLPPSLLAMLPDEDLPALRTVVSAGESCPWEVALRWAMGRRFMNAYGPTEATIGPTCYVVHGRVDDAQTVPIGYPLPNYHIYLLDAHQQPVSDGASGEIYIGGVGVARGYLNQPELTAERFVSWEGHDDLDGNLVQTPIRLYRTGDLGRCLPEGSIEFLGRIDDQVKLRGFRVEPGEIAAVLRQHPDVQDAVVVVREDFLGDQRLIGYVTAQEPSTVELWPSVAEYFVYDELLYHAMTNDEQRNDRYRAALRQAAPGRVVLDIGTGRDAILARLAVEAGARKVYAIELLEASYLHAQATIERLGLTDRITLIHGDARLVELPELVDVCVSEIVGAIGGSEGASRIINDAWRFMKPGGVMIPSQSITRIAAVGLPDDLLRDLAFTPTSGHYVERIFEQRGYVFDLRICLRGARRDDLLSTTGILEDLDFTGISAPEYDRVETLEITKTGRIDGFLAWLNLHTAPGEELDILDREYCWLPVFFPVFSPGVIAYAGDRIEMTISSRLCDNGLNPDYFIQGRLVHQDGSSVPFEYNSYHYLPSFRQSPFYARLFAGGTVPIRQSAATIDPAALRVYLQERLAPYMIPSAFVQMASFPLTVNGKVDRAALPLPLLDTPLDQVDAAPRTADEVAIVRIWAQVLGRAAVGIHDDFFAIGGHSLLAARAIALISEQFERTVPLRMLFEAPTVATFSLAMANSPVTKAEHTHNLAADVVLDPDIVPLPLDAATGAPETIFLTGATGYAGTFLLQELLKQTQATIVCLVRAPNDEAAKWRIQQALTRYGLWHDAWDCRIVAIAGDLSRTHFGLEAGAYERLATEVDGIYHAGAQVHYLHPYATLKHTNVQGVLEILRFASTMRAKPIHYVSTLAVTSTGSGSTYEDDALPACTSTLGYVQSKWVAEGIMHLARERGFQISIYRPGRIGPDSLSGAANPDDFFIRLVAACIQLGIAPDVPMVENLVSVDYVARTIVHLAQSSYAGRTFHITNPVATTWGQVIDAMRSLGYAIRLVSYADWRATLRTATSLSGGHALHGLVELMPEDQASATWIDSWTRQTFDSRNVVEGLSGSGLQCPIVDRPFLERMLTEGIRRGFFGNALAAVAPFGAAPKLVFAS